MSIRLFRALAAALLLVGLSLPVAVAGGWATIAADDSNPQNPRAGEAFTFGFTVLQHGVTPAGWIETPTFVGTNPATGERVEAKATGQGADGHFVATVTVPTSGYWTWAVELTDLVVESPPLPLVVATADGALPSVNTAEMLAAVERTRNEIRTDYEARLATQAEELRGEMSTLSTQVRFLQSQRDALSAKVAALEAAPAAGVATPTTVDGGLPLIGVILISVLAGALSGFAVAYLGRSQASAGRTDGPIEDLTPSGEAIPSH
jgi:hypothetical protein